MLLCQILAHLRMRFRLPQDRSGFCIYIIMIVVVTCPCFGEIFWPRFELPITLFSSAPVLVSIMKLNLFYTNRASLLAGDPTVVVASGPTGILHLPAPIGLLPVFQLSD